MSFVQKSVLAGCFVVGAWSLAGLIANPDFSTGADATSKTVLFVDMNGWHALTGFLIVAPGLYAARSEQLSTLFAPAASFGLVATAVWAIFSERPLGQLVYFPHARADVVLHLATAAIFLAGWLTALRSRHKTPAASV